MQTDPISLLPLHSPVAPEAMQGELPNRMEEEWFTGKLVMGNALVDNESSDGLRVRALNDNLVCHEQSRIGSCICAIV